MQIVPQLQLKALDEELEEVTLEVVLVDPEMSLQIVPQVHLKPLYNEWAVVILEVVQEATWELLEALVVYQFVPLHLSASKLEGDRVLGDLKQIVPFHVLAMEAVTKKETVQAVVGVVVEVFWV